MKTIITIIAALYTAQSGVLSAYDLEPTVATIEARQSWGHIPSDLDEYDMFIAVPDCGRVGDNAIVIVGDTLYKAIAFDCGGDDGGHDWMLANGVVAEVDYWNFDLAFERAKLIWVD